MLWCARLALVWPGEHLLFEHIIQQYRYIPATATIIQTFRPIPPTCPFRPSELLDGEPTQGKERKATIEVGIVGWWWDGAWDPAQMLPAPRSKVIFEKKNCKYLVHSQLLLLLLSLH